MALRPEHSQVPVELYAVCRVESALQSEHARTPQSSPGTAPTGDPPVFLPRATSEKRTRHRTGRILRSAILGMHTCGSGGLAHTRARPRSDLGQPDRAWLPFPGGSNWHHCSRRLQTPIPPAPDNRDFRRTLSGPPSDWRSSDSPSVDLKILVHKSRRDCSLNFSCNPVAWTGHRFSRTNSP